MKRFLALVLCVALSLSLIPAVSVQALTVLPEAQMSLASSDSCSHSFNVDNICTLCGCRKITIELADSCNDSWNGNSIGVYTNGELVQSVTITSGGSSSYYVMCDPHKTYQFVWSKGSWSGECSFTIKQWQTVLFTATKDNCSNYSDGQTVYKLSCEHEYGSDRVCDHCGWKMLQLQLVDSYGDTWNGCAIQVYKGDELLGNATVSSGSSATVDFPYDSTQPYTFKWTKGSYASECSFQIYLGNGLKLSKAKGDCSSLVTDEVLLRIDAECDHVYLVQETQATCTDAGYTNYLCRLCSQSHTGNSVDALGHDYESVVTDATCTTAGYTTYTCSRCDDSYTGSHTDPLGHDLGADTCCTRCGAQYMRILMSDSASDGWHGNTINVYADGESVGNATISSGGSGELQIPYDSTKKYTFYWTKASWPSECSFTVERGGETVFTASKSDCGGYTNGQLIFTLIDNCSHSYTDGPYCDYCGAPLMLDLVFLIDTTGSMGNELDILKANVNDYLSVLDQSGAFYNIALVDYRDFSDRADSSDYPYNVVLNFTNNPTEIVNGMNQLNLGYGGDTEETAYSGLIDGLDSLSWRVGSVRQVILISDAPPLDPEPNTGYELEQVIDHLNENNICVHSLSTRGTAVSQFDSIAEQTGGTSYYNLSISQLESVLDSTISSISASLHVHSYVPSVTPPTCTMAGFTTYTCSGCNDSYTGDTVAATGHSMNSSRVCSVCQGREITVTLSDSYGDGWNGCELELYREDTLSHTFTISSGSSGQTLIMLDSDRAYTFRWDKGSYANECSFTISQGSVVLFSASKSDCNNYTDGQIVYTLGAYCAHSYTDVVTPPTCTAGGYTTHTCSLCGDSYTDSTTAATGHSYGSYVSDGNATCTEDGTKTRTCQTCGNTQTVTDTGSAKGHSYTETVTTAATCTASGVKTHRCSRCSHSYTSNISALGHTYNDTITPPTCTTGGYTTHRCSRCSYSYTDSATSATGHSYGSYTSNSNATCTQDGTKTRTCRTCGNTQTVTDTGSAKGHSYTSRVTTAATCTATGVKTYSCSRCSHSYTESIPATGHSYGDYVANNNATCTQDGTKTRTCRTCGVTQNITDTGSALGHRFVSGFCIRCGAQSSGFVAVDATVKGTLTSGNADPTFLKLYPQGSSTPFATLSLSNGSYVIYNLAPGAYQLTLEKDGHLSRTYSLNLTVGDNKLDLKIHLEGDITGDGRINVGDVARAYGHSKKTSLITDPYQLLVADLTGDNRINVGDVSRLYAKVKTK